LVRRDRLAAPDDVIRTVQEAYAFLGEMTEAEARLAGDPYGREVQIYNQLLDNLRGLA